MLKQRKSVKITRYGCSLRKETFFFWKNNLENEVLLKTNNSLNTIMKYVLKTNSEFSVFLHHMQDFLI